MITLSALTLLYFVPTIIAGRRGHDVLWPLLVNVFIGWTVIGWLALFLWALLWDPPHYSVPAGYYPYRG
ncbi:MAG TPA: superinfection immunity protein [Acidobacteriaceae bacterium]|nr:superinfection immunity protein [Acidobacteriaceae bacterium]